MKLKLRQWRAIHCRRHCVVILGARRTGKSYTAERLAVKYLEKCNDVIYLVENRKRGLQSFKSIHSIISQENKKNHYIEINHISNKIKVDYNTLIFSIPEENFEEVIRINGFRPAVVVADEIDNIPKLLAQISFINNHYNLNIKKIFITGTPNPTNRPEFVSILFPTKVYVWKLENNILRQLMK